MPRPIWTGAIVFGLVTVPVKAYTAVRDHDVSFRQLVKGTGARVRYRKVAEDSGEEVSEDDIELGYEVSTGQYATFSKDELDDLRPTATKTIEVDAFVALGEVDPIFYERTYWLQPDGDTSAKAYQLLLAAMQHRERVGIGTVVLRNKQHLAAIRPFEGVLAVSTMRFADEIVSQPAVVGLAKSAQPEGRALDLAVQIIDSLEAPWQPDRYHDTYTDELRARIEAKAAGEELTLSFAPTSDAEVLDLMAALERSVESTERRAPSRRPRKRKSA